MLRKTKIPSGCDEAMPEKSIFMKPIPTLAGLMAVVALITVIMLRNGISAGPDEWAYWQGSVNLLEHGTYTYMDGRPLFFWPPLFALFLAFFQFLFSQTGWALCVAMSAVAALNMLTWGSYVFNVFPAAERKTPAFLGSLAFVFLFLPLSSMDLMSNGLALVFVGGLFSCIASTSDRAQLTGLRKATALGLLSLGALLSHSSSIIFVLVTVAVVFLGSNSSPVKRVAGCAVILFISILPWIVIRAYLGQLGSHSISAPRSSPSVYLQELTAGFGTYFTSSGSPFFQSLVGMAMIAGALFLAARPSGIESSWNHRLLISLGLLSVAGFFIMFNTVFIIAILGSRFVAFFAACMAPLYFYGARKHLALLVVLMTVPLIVLGNRDAKRIWHGQILPLTNYTADAKDTEIHPAYYLTSRQKAPSPAGTVRILVPIYPWEENGAAAPSSEAKVRFVHDLPE